MPAPPSAGLLHGAAAALLLEHPGEHLLLRERLGDLVDVPAGPDQLSDRRGEPATKLGDGGGHDASRQSHACRHPFSKNKWSSGVRAASTQSVQIWAG